MGRRAAGVTLTDYISSPTPTLIDFGAEWCAPCRVLAPIIKEVKKQFGDRLNVLKVDVDKNPQVAAHYSIQGVPTLILFRTGTILWRVTGLLPEAELKRVMAQFL